MCCSDNRFDNRFDNGFDDRSDDRSDDRFDCRRCCRCCCRCCRNIDPCRKEVKEAFCAGFRDGCNNPRCHPKCDC